MNPRLLPFCEDIVTHPDFERLKSFNHHKHITIHAHVLRVAEVSYKWAKCLNLNAVSVLRGALLHDFFLYDWMIDGKITKKRGLKKHGFVHARIAHEEASKRFNLSYVESDIILHHMFPLNISPPKTLEGWLVMVMDKGVSLMDYLNRH